MTDPLEIRLIITGRPPDFVFAINNLISTIESPIQLDSEIIKNFNGLSTIIGELNIEGSLCW